MEEILFFSRNEFESLRKELVSEIQKLLQNSPTSNWLRSKDVRKMLGISDSTLQTMRINGTIPAYKLGESWFYKHDEIIAALESGKIRKEVGHD